MIVVLCYHPPSTCLGLLFDVLCSFMRRFSPVLYNERVRRTDVTLDVFIFAVVKLLRIADILFHKHYLKTGR